MNVPFAFIVPPRGNEVPPVGDEIPISISSLGPGLAVDMEISLMTHLG
jgi:hypothetical protein